MKTVTILGKTANEIIDIVHEMKKYGWETGVDFDWEYHKGQSLFGSDDRHTIFYFHKEEYSTYFALRWL